MTSTHPPSYRHRTGKYGLRSAVWKLRNGLALNDVSDRTFIPLEGLLPLPNIYLTQLGFRLCGA